MPLQHFSSLPDPMTDSDDAFLYDAVYHNIIKELDLMVNYTGHQIYNISEDNQQSLDLVIGNNGNQSNV